MNFYEKFLNLCRERNLTPSRALLNADLSKSLANKWKKAPDVAPNGKTLAKLANYFEVPVEALMPDCFTVTLTGLGEEPGGADRFKSDENMLDFLEKGTKKEPGLSTELSDDIIDVVDKIHSLSDEKQKLFLQLANPLLDSLMSGEK